MSFAPGDPLVADPVSPPAEVRTGPAGPRWVRPAVAALVVAGLTASGLSTWAIWQVPTRPIPAAGSSTGPNGANGSSGDAAGQIDRSIKAILDRRGQAVQRHDRAAFLADLDPTLPALRAQQRAIFDGLTKLDFAQFSYRANGSAFDPGAHGTGRGDSTYIAGVVATHQLRGYDSGPVAEAMAVTFVRRDNRWWVASDRDVDDDLPAAGHAEPWDDGQVGVAKGTRSLVIGQARDDDTLRQVAAAVDKAVAADITFWPTGNGVTRWKGQVVVYVPRAQREFTSLFRGSKQTADGVVAVAVPVYDNVTFGQDYGQASGHVTGSRIIINPKYFRPKSSFFAVTLRHEVSHVAAEPVTADGTPSWLVEGLAEYVGWRQRDPSRTFYARGVDRVTARAVNAHTYRLRLPSSSTFYLGQPATISAHYTSGFLACAYIQHRFGEAKLKTFVARMGQATTSAKESAVLKSALRRTFGLTQAGLESGATAWLQQFTIRS